MQPITISPVIFFRSDKIKANKIHMKQNKKSKHYYTKDNVGWVIIPGFNMYYMVIETQIKRHWHKNRCEDQC